MSSIIKETLGIAPQEVGDNLYKPSPMALKMATSSETDYDNTSYPAANQVTRERIMMICTEEGEMTMANGKKFATGNHPVEMFVPMLHLEKAGFTIDIFTPTGKPVQVEMWAMPEEDEAVMGIYNKHKAQLNSPHSLETFVADSMTADSPYIALFIPGGHGAMLGLPESKPLGKLLNWARKEDIHVLAICHGPAALLAAYNLEPEQPFLYSGYEIAAFPDSMDKQTPKMGYLPGEMPWYFGEELEKRGINIINDKAAGTCHQYFNLITGDSPQAANDFGKMAANALLEKVKKQNA